MNRQQYKESACYLAIRQGHCLVRRVLEVHAISAHGQMKCVSRSSSSDTVWQDAYNKLKGETPAPYQEKVVDPYELPQDGATGWKPRAVDPDTGFIVKSE